MKTSKINITPTKALLPTAGRDKNSNDSENGGMVTEPAAKEEKWQSSLHHHPLSSSSPSLFSQTRNIADYLMTRQELTGLTLATRRQGRQYPIQPQNLASSVAW
jgi:hypothetical protein